MSKEIKIDLSKLDYVMCPDCGAMTFEKVFYLKLIPRLMVGAPADQYASIELHRCIECGYVMLPEGLKPKTLSID